MYIVMEVGVSGKSVMIIGVGIIGLMVVIVVWVVGVVKILVSDVDEWWFVLVWWFGVDEVY